MIKQWQSEKVGCHLVQRQQDSVPGLYMIEVDGHGERSFLYWRENSPASKLFDNREASIQLFSLLSSFGHIYLSGISLALYNDDALNRLFEFLQSYRQSGGKVYFDGNYRPKLWGSKANAVATYETMYGLTDIALPTIEDEQMVFGNDTPDAIIERIHSYGVSEVVLKVGSKGCLVSDGKGSHEKSPELVESNKVNVVDTTSAGDSFNAGYLASRISGNKPSSAALAGHQLASIVIQHRGAIIPVEMMPKDN